MNSVPPCASSSAPTLRPCAPLLAFDAEQLDFHVLRRDRGGVDHDERRVGARRMGMDRARGKLLAAARWADDEDAAVGRRHLLDRLAQLIGGRRVADDHGGQRGELLEFLAPRA